MLAAVGGRFGACILSRCLMPDVFLGYIDIVDYIDGVWRPVYVDEHGKQFVYDDNGERVYEAWLYPEDDQCDLPVIVPAEQPDE